VEPAAECNENANFLAPSALCGIEQVSSVKLLGVIFKNNLSFDEHVTAVLKCCSQRAYIQ